MFENKFLAPRLELKQSRSNRLLSVNDFHVLQHLLIRLKGGLSSKEGKKCAFCGLRRSPVAFFLLVSPVLFLFEIVEYQFLDVSSEKSGDLFNAEELNCRGELRRLPRKRSSILSNHAGACHAKVTLHELISHVNAQ